MDATTYLPFGADSPGPMPKNPHRTELLLDALKIAIATPGEHRLFRSGKLRGLFHSKVGLAMEASLVALREGLLETARTEVKGKIIIEWVQATPKAMTFIDENDSPKSILRELKGVLATTRAGIPQWLMDVKQETANLSAKFEKRAAEMLRRLDELTIRVESALRRAEANGPVLAEPVSRVVPWAVEALEYLDRRSLSGIAGDCSLPELFHAIRVKFTDLSLPAFHSGLQRLQDVRALRLIPSSDMSEPEYALVVGGQMMGAVGR
ncbi:MAG TPA: hypothetical protein VG097_03040 [Gemmata sp.]|nr:hypothetical protein [Gemmata sp.]